MKMIIENKKPTLEFECNVCDSVWITNKWISKIVSTHMVFMGGDPRTVPTCSCPVCHVETSKYSKTKLSDDE